MKADEEHDEENVECPLCGDIGGKRGLVSADGRGCHLCPRCDLIFADASCHLGVEEERRRYVCHENSIGNEGYVSFLNQIIEPALGYLRTGMRGLDFGSGPTPVLSGLLAGRGFACDSYDPLFPRDELKPPYDFIFSTECLEHFRRPGDEIAFMLGLLAPGGMLAVMTELWVSRDEFSKWYYSRDSTHLSFYNARTLDYVRDHFALSELWRDGRRCALFRKKTLPGGHCDS